MSDTSQVDNDSISGPGDGTNVHEDTVVNNNKPKVYGQKEDWFETRINAPKVEVSFLTNLYGKDGFKDMKSKEDYWEDQKIQKIFEDKYGPLAELEFDKAYEASQLELSAARMGAFKASKNILDIARENSSYLASGVALRDINTPDTLAVGNVMTDALRDPRTAAEAKIRLDKKNPDGSVTTEYNDYSIDLFRKMDRESSFEGLAYGDELYEGGEPALHVIQEGQIYSDKLSKWVDVRNDQVVSRLDINTGNFFDGWFDNNKLESEGALDYLAAIGRAPMNMATNILDIFAQFGRAGIAGYYGLSNKIFDENRSVREDDTYKWLTSKGIQIKGHLGSSSREAMTDGFFGSFETFLSTVLDVGLQVGLARVLSKGASMGAGAVGESLGMETKAIAEMQQWWAGKTVKSVLMTMATKDSYNEALETGFNETEASIITGIMTIAMWHAAGHAEKYIAGNFEATAARKNIRESLRTKLQDWFGSSGFKSITDETSKKGKENFMKAAFGTVTKSVNEAFKKNSTFVPSSIYRYAAQQEAIEEMTEELYQDLVKHAASAYGVLMKNAQEKGKGRYFTIFDEGYLVHAANRYATSGIAGGMGGPMGMIGTSVNLRTISSTASVVDIIQAGKLDALIEVVNEMQASGELAPTDLSTEYDAKIQAFIPMISGKEQTTLSDMVGKSLLEDINVVNIFMNEGLFGQVREKFKTDADFKKSVEGVSMTKDFISLTGRVLDLHAKTGMTTGFYQELDNLTEEELADELESGVIDNKLIELQKARDRNKTISGDVTAADINKEKKEEEEAKKAEAAKVDKDGNPIVETATETESRLEREINLAPNATSTDVKDILDSYRKIRAMHNGTASEYYLMQNELTQDEAFGAMAYRKEAYKELGHTPFVDHIMALRVKSIKAEKEHEYKKKKSLELEEQLDAINEITPDTYKEVSKILRESAGILSKKAIKKIIDLGKDIDYIMIEAGLDPDGDSYIFENENEVREAMEALLRLDPDSNEEIEYVEKYKDDAEGVEDFLSTNTEGSKYFKTVSKNISESRLPRLATNVNEYGEVKGKYIEKSSVGLVDSVKRLVPGSPGANKLINLFNNIPQEVYDYRAISNRVLSKQAPFDPNSFDIKSIDHLFNTSELLPGGVTITSMPVATAVTSQVNSLLDSSVDGDKLFGLKDKAAYDKVAKQLKHKLLFADVFERFMPSNHELIGSYYPNLLAKFRMNVLAISEGMYDPHASIDTLKERHPYKDFTAFSDMFVDYLYDPIRMSELMAMDKNMIGVDEQAELDAMHTKKAYFQSTAVYTDANGDPVNTFVYPDFDVIKANLDIRFNQLSGAKDFRLANEMLNKEFLELPKSALGLPGSGVAALKMDGATKLKVLEWLLDGVGTRIEAAVDVNSESMFFTEKKLGIKESYRIFEDLFNHELIDDVFRNMLEKEVPLWFDATLSSPEFISDEDYVNVGRLNIQLERFLHRLYSGDIDTNKYNVDKQKAVDNIFGYLKELGHVNSNYAVKKDMKEDYITILSALTTDFTPFYAEFKTVIQSLNLDTDVIVTAPQENAAKFAAAAIYSNTLLEEHSRLMRDIQGDNYSKNSTDIHLNALYVTGMAGSGKTSAVTNLGMQVANNILAGRQQASKVLAVSNNRHQIDNLVDSIGDKSLGKGMDVSTVLDLLYKAVVTKDKGAIDTLSGASTVLIDEVTYLEYYDGSKTTEGLDQLNKINDYINLYNKQNRNAKNNISLVILGDSDQGASYKAINNSFVETGVTARFTLATKYLNFSHRSRNSYTTDSMEAILKAKPKLTFDDTSTSEIEVGKGLKYGIKNDMYYGINLRDATKEGSIDFIEEMNNAAIVSNIKKNMDAAIADNKKFEVLIAPESLDTFTNNDSLMLELYNNDAYKKFFKLRKVSAIGGSEAHYAFVEMPDIHTQGIIKDTSYISMLFTTLNTVASRAIHYSSVINKSPGIIIYDEAIAKRIDGEVLIPSMTMERKSKEKVQRLYMNILADIKATEVVDNGSKDGIIDGFTDTVDIDVVEEATQEYYDALDENLASVVASLDLDELTTKHLDENMNKLIDTLEAIHEVYAALLLQEDNIDTLQQDLQDTIDGLKASDPDLYNTLVDTLMQFTPDNLTGLGPDVLSILDANLQVLLDTIEGYHFKLDKDNKVAIYEVELADGITLVDIFDSIVTEVSKTGSKKSLAEYIRTGDFKYLKHYLEGTISQENMDVIEQLLNSTYENTQLTEDEAKAVGKRLYNMLKLLNITGTLKVSNIITKPSIEAGNILISELKFFLFSASTTTLADTIEILKNNDGKTFSIPGAASATIRTMLDNYDQASVFRAFTDVLSQVLSRKRYINGLEANAASIEVLKGDLGIKNITDPVKLFVHAIKLKNDAIAQLTQENTLAHFTIFHVNKLLSLISDVHRDSLVKDKDIGRRAKEDVNSFFFYYNRGKDKYTLQDYMDEQDQADPNKTYSIDVPGYIASKLAGTGYDVVPAKDRMNFLGFTGNDPDNINAYTSTEILVMKSIDKNGNIIQVKNGKGEMMDKFEILVVAIDPSGGKKKVFGRYDTSFSNGRLKNHKVEKYMMRLNEDVKFKDLKAGEHKGVEVSGSPKNNFHVRAGKTNTNKKGKWLSDVLQTSPVNIATNIYVVMKPDSLFAGEAFIPYSWDQGMDMDSESLKRDLGNEGYLGRNRRIKTGQGVNSEIGILPVNLRPKFKKLVEVFSRPDNTVKLTTYTSIFSLTLQKYFADSVLNMNVGDVFKAQGVEDVVITDEIKAYAKSLLDDFEMHLAGSVTEEANNIRNKVINAIDTIKGKDGGSGLESVMKQLLSIQLQDEFDSSQQGGNRPLLYKNNNNFTVLNITKLALRLKGSSDTTFDIFDTLADITGYELRPAIIPTDTGSSDMTARVDPDFVKEFMSFINVPVTSVEPGGLVMNDSMLEQAIARPAKGNGNGTASITEIEATDLAALTGVKTFINKVTKSQDNLDTTDVEQEFDEAILTRAISTSRALMTKYSSLFDARNSSDKLILQNGIRILQERLDMVKKNGPEKFSTRDIARSFKSMYAITKISELSSKYNLYKDEISFKDEIDGYDQGDVQTIIEEFVTKMVATSSKLPADVIISIVENLYSMDKQVVVDALLNLEEGETTGIEVDNFLDAILNKAENNLYRTLLERKIKSCL